MLLHVTVFDAPTCSICPTELVESYEFSDDKNYNFYIKIKLNYLLSTFQLNEACDFKEELDSKIKIDFLIYRKLLILIVGKN